MTELTICPSCKIPDGKFQIVLPGEPDANTRLAVIQCLSCGSLLLERTVCETTLHKIDGLGGTKPHSPNIHKFVDSNYKFPVAPTGQRRVIYNDSRT